MELSTKEREVINQLASDLRLHFSAVDVRLFGSAATGKLDAESDLDVYVLVPVLSWPMEQAICDRCYEATLACGRLIAATVVSVDELEQTPLRSSPFMRAVQREGVTL